MSKHTFNIHTADGTVLATISFHNYGANTARNEALKVADLLADSGWSISEGQLTRLASQGEGQVTPPA